MLANDAGTGWSPRLAVGGAGTISNSQCAIEGSGSSLSESESGLGVTVPLTFDVSFGGPKSIYAMAVDSAGGTSGWQSVGTWSVPSRAPSISLDARNPRSGLAITFSLTAATSDGGAAVGRIGLKIQSVTGSDSCLVAYDPASNTLQLSEDNSGARWSAPLPLDGVGTIANPLCAIHASGSSVAIGPGMVTLSVLVTFDSAFAGPKNLYGLALDTQATASDGSCSVRG